MIDGTGRQVEPATAVRVGGDAAGDDLSLVVQHCLEGAACGLVVHRIELLDRRRLTRGHHRRGVDGRDLDGIVVPHFAVDELLDDVRVRIIWNEAAARSDDRQQSVSDRIPNERRLCRQTIAGKNLRPRLHRPVQRLDVCDRQGGHLSGLGSTADEPVAGIVGVLNAAHRGIDEGGLLHHPLESALTVIPIKEDAVVDQLGLTAIIKRTGD